MTTIASTEGTAYLRDRLGAPRAGIVLGSGFGALARAWGAGAAVPFADIPGYPQCLAEGHHGGVAAVSLAGSCVWIFLGRLHGYEHVRSEAPTLPLKAPALAPPVRLARACRTLLTAAGFDVWFDRVNMPAVTVDPGNSVLPFQRIDSFRCPGNSGLRRAGRPPPEYRGP